MAIDWTEKEILLLIVNLEDMYKRGVKYAKEHPKEKEFKVYVNFKTKTDYISWPKVKSLKNDLAKRITEYENTNKETPHSVWVNKPKTTATIKKDPEWMKNKYILQVAKKIGSWRNGKEFVEKIRAYAKKKGGLYKYYLNSRLLGTQKEIDGLTNGSLGNCVDWSQFGYAMFKIMGFVCRYAQWACTNVTHLTVEVYKLITNNYDVVDLAAIVDANSRRYEIGEHWCSNKRVATNPNWMFEKGAVV
ncbi:hypothetical protein MBCUT_07030 [Methanobrevibacter cuticularis]|uniref:Transglutaminase-like domain-containing protein n=1 Tax=Methanobrevibacter cuticularis TaxID=47311 RepID=A0A166EHP4_9EURY|nr:hypothetical protein [Methanobrevibacter cuticularis]KZX16665.1 hypothetical protein MBCUT_07030 [Methanobrevibacter cuticularis]